MYQLTFAKAASDYENYALPQAKASFRLVERLLENIDTHAICSLVDIGCGTAFATKLLLQMLNAAGAPYPDECLLIDQEPRMLEVALHNLRSFNKLYPQCVLVDAFDCRWMPSFARGDQSLGRRLLISSYLLQWSMDPLNILLGSWHKLLAKEDVLAISFPDSRSFNWLRTAISIVGLDDRNLKLFDSDVILGAAAFQRLSKCYEIISWGQDDDSIPIKQPSEYLKHFSRIGSTPAVQRYSLKEVRRILQGIYQLAEDGYPCRLDYYSTWILLRRR